MRVLVCDDDRSTRFVIHRLLAQRMECEVTECGDGVEALERLGRGDIDLLILDITMPTLDGLDVLESIRRSPRFEHLPVIMLSHERREEVVVKLIHLGILGYVAKPPRAEALIALVERARQAARRSDSMADVRLDAQTPALVIDGQPEYRTFFATHGEAYGKITLAESGLSALAMFKRDPRSLVFIGGDLGVIKRDLLVRKLREMRPSAPLRIVDIREGDEGAPATAGADDVMPRTLSIPEHRSALRRFVRVTGPLDDLYAVTGDLGGALMAASTQVFGMMLDSDVYPATAPVGGSDVCATLDVTVRHHFLVRLDLWLSAQDARRVAAGVRSLAIGAVVQEDIRAAMSEIMRVIGGRLQAGLAVRQVECECASPRVRQQESMEIDLPADGYGLQLPFTTEGGASFTLLARVENGSERAAISADAV